VSKLIEGTDGNNSLSGTSGADNLQGYAGNDTMRGNAGGDSLDGGAGDDILSGGTGNDNLYGRTGRDVLAGGAGNDALWGGGNADVFQFRGNWGADKIVGFQNGLDKLDLRTTGLTFQDLAIGAADLDHDGLVDDAVIHGNGHSIALLNLKAALIDASDFLF
jgi:Ca2+-binding RTX toxin-like protein